MQFTQKDKNKAKEDDEVKEEASEPSDDDDEDRGAPTPFFDVVVLERSQKRKPKIPLGISVAELKEVSGIHFRRIRLHGAKEEAAFPSQKAALWSRCSRFEMLNKISRLSSPPSSRTNFPPKFK